MLLIVSIVRTSGIFQPFRIYKTILWKKFKTHLYFNITYFTSSLFINFTQGRHLRYTEYKSIHLRT